MQLKFNFELYGIYLITELISAVSAAWNKMCVNGSDHHCHESNVGWDEILMGQLNDTETYYSALTQASLTNKMN